MGAFLETPCKKVQVLVLGSIDSCGLCITQDATCVVVDFVSLVYGVLNLVCHIGVGGFVVSCCTKTSAG